jgi:hypothetical protein
VGPRRAHRFATLPDLIRRRASAEASETRAKGSGATLASPVSESDAVAAGPNAGDSIADGTRDRNSRTCDRSSAFASGTKRARCHAARCEMAPGSSRANPGAFRAKAAT